MEETDRRGEKKRRWDGGCGCECHGREKVFMELLRGSERRRRRRRKEEGPGEKQRRERQEQSRAEEKPHKKTFNRQLFFFQVSSEAAICWSLAAITTSRYLRRAYFQMGGREEDLWM